jgi:hypothetical protein
MPTITLTAVVDENGHLALDVPLPPGPVEVVVRPVTENGESEAPQPGTREWARAKLIAAGHLDPNARYAPPEAQPLSPEERAQIGRALAAGRPVTELIDEEREERF